MEQLDIFSEKKPERVFSDKEKSEWAAQGSRNLLHIMAVYWWPNHQELQLSKDNLSWMIQGHLASIGGLAGSW